MTVLNVYAALEDRLGHRFKNQEWLERALTHSSKTGVHSYERLEFLGDRVLGLVIAHKLFETFTDESEGGLAKRLSALVQGRTLVVVATEIRLGGFLKMSEAERLAGGAENDNTLADAMEAVLGAIYLDGGLEAVRATILSLWNDKIHTLTDMNQDPKTELQEWVQARALPLPEYEILTKSGPDHAPIFVLEVRVQGHAPIQAEGSSRRVAERLAAQKMLSLIKGKQQV